MKMRFLVLAGAMLALPGAVANADHAIDPGTASTEALPFEPVKVEALPIAVAPIQAGAVLPPATRETCTTTFWLADEVRSVCLAQTVAARRSEPALRGICITSYGHRTCY